MNHPTENELSLLAGGECNGVSRFFLMRHVRACSACAAALAGYELLRYETLRAELSAPALPEIDWTRLSAEMKANIRLGLEAGECVRESQPRRQWNPRLAVAFASLTILVAAGLTLNSHEAPAPAAQSSVPVLESTGVGLEFRDGQNSITLINRQGAVADQSVSAQGEIRARFVEHGAVTINNVSLE